MHGEFLAKEWEYPILMGKITKKSTDSKSKINTYPQTISQHLAMRLLVFLADIACGTNHKWQMHRSKRTACRWTPKVRIYVVAVAFFLHPSKGFRDSFEP